MSYLISISYNKFCLWIYINIISSGSWFNKVSFCRSKFSTNLIVNIFDRNDSNFHLVNEISEKIKSKSVYFSIFFLIYKFTHLSSMIDLINFILGYFTYKWIISLAKIMPKLILLSLPRIHLRPCFLRFFDLEYPSKLMMQ